MKVIIILDQFAPTETNRHLLDDALFLRRQDIDVRIVTLSSETNQNTLYSEVLFTKENFLFRPIMHVGDIRGWKKLIAFLTQEKPDLVIIGGGRAKFFGSIASKFSHVPNIFVFAHDEENIQLSVSFFDDLLYRISDKIIVSSEEAKEVLLSLRLPPPSSKITVISDGIVFDIYGKRPEHDIRKELGFSETDFIFISIAKLIPEKGIDVLLRAFAKIPEGKLIILGDGPEKKSLIELSVRLEIGERVLFLPSYPDVPGLLMEAGAMVFPSKNKESATSFVPGFLSGVPAISSDFSGVEEIITNGVNGIIVRTQDSDELASAMKRISLDPEFRSSLQKNTRKGLEKFSVSAHCAKLLSLISLSKKK